MGIQFYHPDGISVYYCTRNSAYHFQTDMQYVEDRYATRMYIALTRALGVVRIVDTKEALKKDPVLLQLVK